MSLQTDLQPEMVLQKLLTLNYPARAVYDSYDSLLLRVSLLLFSFMLFRLMLLDKMPPLLSVLLALVVCFLVTFLLLKLLVLLRKTYGTKGLLGVFLLFFVIAALVIIL